MKTIHCPSRASQITAVALSININVNITKYKKEYFKTSYHHNYIATRGTKPVLFYPNLFNFFTKSSRPLWLPQLETNQAAVADLESFLFFIANLWTLYLDASQFGLDFAPSRKGTMFWQIFHMRSIGLKASRGPHFFVLIAFKLGESPFLGNENLKLQS